jgi:hypothetical protein
LNVIDARWIDIRNGLFIDITGLSETHPDSQPGIWSCKNYHHYRTDEIYPLRETMFEGVMARVPYSYDKILTDEYKETALVNTQFNGHEWNPNAKVWEKTEETLRKEEEERKKKEDEDEENKKKEEEGNKKKEEEEKKKKEEEEKKKKEEEEKKKKEEEEKKKKEGENEKEDEENKKEEEEKKN